jgi:Tat protein translocase TatC
MLKTAFTKLFQLREQAARIRPGADDGFDAHEKPFLDHLDDLRATLIKIVGTLTISTLACFAFHKKIFDLVQYPAKSKLAEIAPGVSLWDKLELITLGPTEFIMLMLKLSFYSGLIITFPFTVYFLFQFLLPGLKQAEKRTIIPGTAAGFILFLVGASLAFFLTIPLALKYFYVFENERIASVDPVQEAMRKPLSEIALIGIDGQKILPVGSAPDPAPEGTSPAPAVISKLSPEMREEIRTYLSETLTTAEGANFALRYDKTREKLVLVSAKGGKSSYQVGKYISFISQLVLVFGISFQMPIVVTILVKLELLTARVMRETRSYAWVIILVLSALLTPSPDALTMGLLAGPLILLYEICVIIATIIEKTRLRREKAEEDSRRSRMEKLYAKPATDLSEEEKAEMHRADIEQYEREHAHLYLEDSDHVARDSLHGDGHEGDPDHDTPQHDESWHADDHYWHESHDPHAVTDSDHAEPEDLAPEAPESTEDEPPAHHYSEDHESCIPDGPVVDLNHATIEELTTLPGIGPKMAQAIIDNRRYETFDDLDRIPGLGPEKIRRITDRIMLG